MTYSFNTARATFKESAEKAMTVLNEAYGQADMLRDPSDKAEALAEIGKGYALVAQACAEAMDEVA